jgi:GTP cyclohydrolase III
MTYKAANRAAQSDGIIVYAYAVFLRGYSKNYGRKIIAYATFLQGETPVQSVLMPEILMQNCVIIYIGFDNLIYTFNKSSHLTHNVVKVPLWTLHKKTTILRHGAGTMHFLPQLPLR